MADNEIMKALECCSEKGWCVRCPYDHFSDDCDGCTSILAKDSLDLINRHKAEIERLQGAVQEWVDGKCLSQNHLLMIGKLQNEIEQAKAEAIKEFAERLCEGRVSNDPVVIAAKCMLKEMTEETP